MGKIIIETKKGKYETSAFTGLLLTEVFQDKKTMEDIIETFFEEYGHLSKEDILAIRLENDNK